MTSIAIDSMGQRMATAGVDGDVRIWDVRNYKPIHTYFSHAPASNLEISQQGLLAVGFGSRVQVHSRISPCLYGQLGFSQLMDLQTTGHGKMHKLT